MEQPPTSEQQDEQFSRPTRVKRGWLLLAAALGATVIGWALLGRPAGTQEREIVSTTAPKPASFRIPKAWVEHLTPAPPPKEVETRIHGRLLLETLRFDGEPLYRVDANLWSKAGRMAPEEERPSGGAGALRWPGAPDSDASNQARVLEIADSPMELLPPPTEECRIRWWMEGEPLAESDCDLDGGFELSFRGELGRQGWLELNYPGRLAAQMPLQIVEGTIEVGTIALGYGFNAGIEVKDAEGRPLAGVRADLRHYGMHKKAPPWRARSDSQGRIEWTTLPAGAASVELRHPGFRTEKIKIGAPRDQAVSVEMESVERLWGQVYLPADLQAPQQSEQELYRKVQLRLAGSGIWPPKKIRCRDDGSFQFSQIPAGVYAVEAFVDDEELQLASYPLENVPSDHSISLSLVRARSLMLELHDEEGLPVQGAKVSAKSNALGLLARECVSDEVGFCRLAALVPGRYQISVHAEGFLPLQESLDRSLALDDTREEHMIWTLEPAPTCVARILNEQGQGLGLARVWVQRDRPGSQSRKDAEIVAVGVSDADGYVGFDPLPEGRYRLAARLSGWTMDPSVGAGVAFVPGPACGSLQLKMRAGVRVSGSVFDDRGLPVSDASVQLRNRKGRVLARTRSDEQGHFSLDDARGKVELVVRGTGYRPYVEAMKLQPAQGRELELSLRLQVVETGQLELSLVDPHGDARSNMQVEFEDPRGLHDRIFAVADRHGVVELDRLPLGKWRVKAYCAGELCLSRILKWTSSEGVVQKRWVVRDAWQLQLTILDDVAEPVVGAGVRLPQQRMRTDERGEAKFSSLWDDKVLVIVRKREFVTRRLQIERPEDEAPRVDTVTLERAGAIEGEVLDPWGEPLANARIELRWGEGGAQTQSDASGNFVLGGLPQGDWQLQIEPPPTRPDLPARQLPVNVRPQLTTRDVFVTLGEL